MSPGNKVFLTRLLPPDAMNDLQNQFELSYPSHNRQLTLKEIVKGIRAKEGLISMLSDPIDRQVIESCPTLRIIANYAVGYNNIDLAAATAKKIVVTNTPGVLTETTADLTWALILAVSRRLIEADRVVRSGRWKGWAPTELLGHDVSGRTLGIIGLGRIGRAVATRAKAFSMQIRYFSRHRVDPSMEEELGVHYVPLDDLLGSSDYVSVHVPLDAQTHHLIGRRQLLQMKPTAYLINTARGPIVDEKALIEVLQKRQIAGAGLDVYEHEPRISPKLRRLKNVVLLPHIGSASIQTRNQMGFMVAENLSAFFEKKTPPHQVNPF
jgi:glyoxylate reductase